MKKLSQLLLIAFSLVFVLSCNKDEEIKTTKLTNEQKVALLNDYEWLPTKPITPASNLASNQEEDPCSYKDKFIFNAERNEGGLYYGTLTSYSYTTIMASEGEEQAEGEDCEELTYSSKYTYNPTSNKIILEYKIDPIEPIDPMPAESLAVKPFQAEETEEIESPILMTNTTLRIDDTIYYKGSLIKR